MKIEAQINLKIKEIETHIDDLWKNGITNECTYNLMDNYVMIRKALQWVLSDNDKIPPDDYEKNIRWAMLCYEASQIF